MLRLLLIGGVIIVLLVPIEMIRSLVLERQNRRNEAVQEISNMWAATQVVSGPLLTLPYRCPATPATKATPSAECHSELVVQPRDVTITGTVTPEVRRRSLFEAVVYRADLRISATFVPDVSEANPVVTELIWDNARVHVGVADPRGVIGNAELVSGTSKTPFAPGVVQGQAFSTGMYARVGSGRPGSDGAYAVSLAISLNGTQELAFAAGGNDVSVKVNSTWEHPSFIGAALPTSWTRESPGFSAEWKTGQFWRVGKAQPGAAQFGVAFIRPVDVYQQADRAVKYAFLFLMVTFVVAFLWEITKSIPIHPIQYIFVGFVSCLFYLLLLSISEHFDFDVAYFTATAVTVALLGWYWRWATGTRAQGAAMAAVLAMLYSFLYLLLRLEDYALLAGSAALFIGMALVMYATRRINWFNYGQDAGAT